MGRAVVGAVVGGGGLLHSDLLHKEARNRRDGVQQVGLYSPPAVGMELGRQPPSWNPWITRRQAAATSTQ